MLPPVIQRQETNDFLESLRAVTHARALPRFQHGPGHRTMLPSNVTDRSIPGQGPALLPGLGWHLRPSPWCIQGSPLTVPRSE